MTGLEIKLLRIKNGLKQIQVAQSTGINQARLSQIENEWVNPKKKELNKIVKAIEEDK